jgi:hypothetical protein
MCEKNTPNLQYRHVDDEFSERAVLYDARARHTLLVQISSILADLSQKVNPGLQSKRLVTDHLSCGAAQVVCTVPHFYTFCKVILNMTSRH